MLERGGWARSSGAQSAERVLDRGLDVQARRREHRYRLLSAGPTSSSISVQPSTIPPAPGATRRPITSRYAARESDDTTPLHSSS